MRILAILTVACLFPFITKAFHMDDPLFLWIAQHIQKNPSDPLGFNVVWYWTEEPISTITKNPPLASYYIAGVATVFGWSEVALHAAFLVPAVAVVLGTYLLARSFCRQPFLAALMALLTPVFLVSSTTIMCDTMMLALWVFSLYLWIRGMEKKSTLAFFFSGVLIAAAALTKYYAISLILLLLVYSVLKRRRLEWFMTYLLIPVAILAAYQWITAAHYGRGLLADAIAYATQVREPGRGFLEKGLVGLTFTGGCVIGVLFFTNLLWSRKIIVAGAAGVLAVTYLASLLKASGEYPVPGESGAYWLRAIQTGLFVLTGVSALALSILDLYRRRDADSLLLFLWVIGTFIFAAFVNWSTNGRSILPIVPAVGIFLVRRIEERKSLRKQVGLRQILIPLVASAAIALAVAWADFRHANSARDAVAEISQRYRNISGSLWFQGHWGFQYYMERSGAKPIDIKHSKFKPGDLVVRPANNTNLFPMQYDWAKLRELMELPGSSVLATMSPQLGAGFYADIRGPLPFALGSVPPEQYQVYHVVGKGESK